MYTTFPLVSVKKKGYRQEMKCIALMGTLDSDVLPVNRKISILMLLLLLSPDINKIMLLVSVDSVAGGLLSFRAGEQGSDCSVKNVTADKESTVVIFLPCLSEVEITQSPGRRNMETRISLYCS